MNAEVKLSTLSELGIDVLPRKGKFVSLPLQTTLEAPCSLKWTNFQHSLELGAFSYQVSGN